MELRAFAAFSGMISFPLEVFQTADVSMIRCESKELQEEVPEGLCRLGVNSRLGSHTVTFALSSARMPHHLKMRRPSPILERSVKP